MTNVTFVSSGGGGICHYTYNAAQNLAEKGVTPHVLVPRGGYELASLPHNHEVSLCLGYRIDGIKRFVVPAYNIKEIASRSVRNGIVHYQWAFGPEFEQSQWPVLKRLGRRIVYTAHNVVPHEGGDSQRAHLEYLYANADAIIVHGEALREQLLNLFPAAAKKAHVIKHGNYNFLCDAYPKWNREKARESFGLADDEIVVLFFGFIRPYKGLDTLIEALGRLIEREPALKDKVRLMIAGKPQWDHWEEVGYEAMLSRTGLADRAILNLDLVAMEDIGRFAHAADIVGLPYKKASQSGVLPTAYAFAKPALVTDTGSLSESLIPEETALLTPPGDPDAMATNLLRLIRDKDLRARIGQAGRRYAEENLSWKTIADQTASLYKNLLEG